MNETEFMKKIKELKKMRYELFTNEIKATKTWNKININCPLEYEELYKAATKFNSDLKNAESSGFNNHAENIIRLLKNEYVELKKLVDNTTWV